MTSLVAWVGVDNRGPASFYLATDSRISWSASQNRNSGRKTYASHTEPHIFAYYGEVLFPTSAITQLLEFIEAGFLAPTPDPETGHKKVVELIQEIHKQSNKPLDYDFAIIHAMRESKSLTSKFHLWEMKFIAKSCAWSDVRIETQTEKSSLILSRGTGSSRVKNAVRVWEKSSSGGTSRAVFSAFCDALASASDLRSGGAPQIVGLYRDGPGQKIGTVISEKRYFFGSPVPCGTDLTIEWRDSLFQRVRGTSFDLVSGAPQQPRPKGT